MILVHRIGETGGAPIQIGAYVWREPDRARLLRRAGSAECAVVVCPGFVGSDAGDWLRELRFTHGSLPIVLCTNAVRSTLVELTGVVDQVVVRPLSLPEITHAIAAATRARWLRGFARRVEAADRMEAGLKELILPSILPAVPYTFVGRLCRDLGISPDTARRRWRAHWSGSPPLRLEDFLAWIALLRAHAAKPPGTSWKRAAGCLGVSRRRLRRWVRRYLGCPDLSAFEELTNAELDAAFERAVCVPLLGEPGLGERVASS